MELRRVAPAVGLVVLLAADAVLIGWAFRPAPTDDYAPSASSVTASPTGSSTVSPSPTSTVKVDPVKPAPLSQFIVAVGPQTAWVVHSGQCTAPGTVVVTADGGASWSSQDLPGRIMRMRPGSATTGFGTGGDKGCTLKQWTTADAGKRWASGADPAGTWSRMPDDPASIHTARDEVQTPCGAREVIDLVPIDAKRANVVCANGDWLSTADGGDKWKRVTRAKGALALTVADGGQGALVTSSSACAGVVVVPISAGRLLAQDSGQQVCVKAATQPGTVSVSNAADTWWLLVKDRVFVADDPSGPWLPTRRNPPA